MKTIWFDTIGSTADTLCAWARHGAAHGTLLVAGRQTAGHGRGEKPFYSPEGGLYFSLLLRQGLPSGGLPVTPRAALAARRVLQGYGCTLGIKWVNDLFREGKKAGGILTQMTGGAAVVSMGINLAPVPVPEELRPIVTWCVCQPKALPSLPALAEEISLALLACNEAPNETLLEEYRAASVVLGQEVAYEAEGRTMRGRAVDITETGELVLEGGVVLCAGEVSPVP